MGIIASIWIKNPPSGFGFGAQEYLTYQIAEGMKKRGHEVTLFATGDSETSVRLVSVSEIQVEDITPADAKTKDIFELINISQAYKMADQFDIIHNHLLPYGLLFADLFKIPTVHTLHHKIYHPSDVYLYKRFKSQNFISISQTQRKVMPELNYIATVYNGIDTGFYSFKEKPAGDYILYLGRLKRYKGIHTAIKLAQKLGIKLKIAAPLPASIQPDYAEVMEYWEKEIMPLTGGNIEHIGEVHGHDKIDILQNAKFVIFPIEWDEPFGMTLVESMACGTPVIAYNKGATREIVADGETGFLINYDDGGGENYKIQESGFDGLVLAAKKIADLPEEEYLKMRRNCRQHTENVFGAERMIDEYEKVYEKIGHRP